MYFAVRVTVIHLAEVEAVGPPEVVPVAEVDNSIIISIIIPALHLVCNTLLHQEST